MNALERFKKISTFIFDVDGVLTDGTVLVLENGVQARRMHIRDGLALQMAIKKQYRVLVVSGANSPQVTGRLEKLGVRDVHMSVGDKKSLVSQYMKQHSLNPDEVLYMGDDLPDIPAMTVVGLTACPADAATEIRESVHYISPLGGGLGCVRDVIEKVLKLNDHWKYEATIASR